MKTALKLLTLTCLVTTLLCGCASNWQTATGKSLATIAQTVDTAMKGWATYVVVAKVQESQQARVRAAYIQYQVAFNTALTAYGGAVSAADQSLLGKTQAALVASQQSLLALITSLSTPKSATP